jgi:hypothetical protein
MLLVNAAETFFGTGLATAALTAQRQLALKIFNGLSAIADGRFNMSLRNGVADTDVHQSLPLTGFEALIVY